jgi:intraflagellar transport protein 46
MNRFLDDDDSSAASSQQSGASLKQRRSIQLPSMYSPTSNASSKNDSTSSPVNNANAKAVVDDIQELPVTNEIKDLFTYIDAYEPVDLDIETPLHCFMPPYVCSVGEPDPMVKIPRPDGVDDGVGTIILDEANPSKQSNPAVLELQLRNSNKLSGRGSNNVVRSIGNVTQHTNEINQWIQSVEEIHAEDHCDKQQSKAELKPNVQELLQAWPKDINEELRNGTLELPKADIALSLAEYSKMMCMLVGIPHKDKSLIDSVHIMLSLYVEMKKQSRG